MLNFCCCNIDKYYFEFKILHVEVSFLSYHSLSLAHGTYESLALMGLRNYLRNCLLAGGLGGLTFVICHPFVTLIQDGGAHKEGTANYTFYADKTFYKQAT